MRARGAHRTRTIVAALAVGIGGLFAAATATFAADDDAVGGTTPAVTLASGTQGDGTPWVFTGYNSNDGLCLEVGYNGNKNAGGGCDWQLSASSPGLFGADADWDRQQMMVYGPVLPAIDQVKVKFAGDPNFSLVLTPQSISTSALNQLGVNQALKVFAASANGAKQPEQVQFLEKGVVVSTLTLPVDSQWPPVDGPTTVPPPNPPDVKSVTHGAFDGNCSLTGLMTAPDTWGIALKRPMAIQGTATCTGTLDGQQLINGKADVSLSGDLTCGFQDVPVLAGGTLRFDELTSDDTSDDTLVDIKAEIESAGTVMDVSGSHSGRALYNGSTSGDKWDCMTINGTNMSGTLRTAPAEPLVG